MHREGRESKSLLPVGVAMTMSPYLPADVFNNGLTALTEDFLFGRLFFSMMYKINLNEVTDHIERL